MLTKYYDELEVGMKKHSGGRTITETDIVMFAALSGDWYPIHTDAEFAKNTMFGQRIAHGMLVMTVSSGLLKIDPGVLVAFYGIDKLRFTNPTFIGDTLYVETEILSKEDKDPFGLVTLTMETKNQRNETVAKATFKVLLNKKGQEE